MKITLQQACSLFKVKPPLDSQTLVVAKKEYHRLAKEYHPDKGGTEEDFKLIREAWGVLEDGCSHGYLQTQEKPKRSPSKLFGELCSYLTKRKGEHTTMNKIISSLGIEHSEYHLLQDWLVGFQKMRYFVGTKVMYIPPKLTLKRYLKALYHVENGGFGRLPNHVKPVSFFKKGKPY